MIGKEIANFRILEKLGEGGMGVVFKAVDTHLDRPVAIKMLNTDLARNPDVVERFRTEAKAQANLNHVNLATLYAFLVNEGNAFMVMEFVDGETIERIISRGGPITPENAVPWFKQALLGIGAAHRSGIVHRDIKPANLMVNRHGIVKVMDFGIAKVVGTRGMTRTGMLQPGTVAYMSPEQIQNRQIDVRTDIYALGVTLYQMLSGHVPFESDSDFQLMNDHISAAPPPLARMYPYAPTEYQNAVMKALEKNPDNRYQTVEEFGAALEHPENVPEWSTAPTLPAVGRPTVLEQRAPMVAAAAAPARAASPVPVPSRTAQPAVTAAPVVVAGPVIVPAEASKKKLNSRYIAAGVIASAAVILLAVVMMARKPPVAQIPNVTGVAPTAATGSGLVLPQVEVTTTGQGNPLDPQGAGGAVDSGKPAQESAGTREAQPVVTSKLQRAKGHQPAPPSPPKPAPQNNSELDEVEHQIDQLIPRAAAVNNSLDRIHQQQAASGYGLRGDIASAQASMQSNLAKAQNAIAQRDAARAKRYADLAAANVETLEHFLGR